MKDLEQSLDKLVASTDADFDGPKPERLIRLAEDALGLTFPPTYRMFLSRLGSGDLFGYEFYGVINEDFEHSGIPDAIWLTLDERRTADLNPSFILISDTGYGGYYAIDTSQTTPGGDNPVVEWHHFDPPEVRRFVAEDFGAFVWERIQRVAKE